MAARMGLLGKKIGMTQKFDAKGNKAALCVVETGPCVVLEVKQADRAGYSAIRLGFGEKSERRTTKPELGQFAKAKTSPKAFVREIRVSAEEAGTFQVGQVLAASQVFAPGDLIDVTGTSKGKGFQGVMKRYHFRGHRATHGTHEYRRHGGSLGCRLTPGHVAKGKRMPGHMGNARVTVQNIKVIEILEEKNLLLLGGAVPGAPDSMLVLRQGVKHAPRAVRLEQPAPAAADAESSAAPE